ncbi:hypothetical protein WG66_003556 [Moniliophthora roreri]|nr:hypothetical protein WG66_003556 [Moniliophthora roreri]
MRRQARNQDPAKGNDAIFPNQTVSYRPLPSSNDTGSSMPLQFLRGFKFLTNLKSSENHHDTSWRKIFRVTWLVKETPNGAFDLGDGPAYTPPTFDYRFTKLFYLEPFTLHPSVSVGKNNICIEDDRQNTVTGDSPSCQC